MGHSSLVVSDEVFSRILTVLRAPERGAAADEQASTDAAEAYAAREARR
jgi:hypothetical protein